GVWTDLGLSYANSVNINNNGQILVSASGGHSYLLTPSDPNAPVLAVTGFASPTTAGAAGAFTITLRNADGSVDNGYAGTVHFSSSDVQAMLPSAYTFTAADAGVHTFNATLKTAGTQSITASDFFAGIAGHETGIVVNPAAASRLRISGPSSTSSGVAFSITVTAYDAFGNVATGYTGRVHFRSSDNHATLPADYTFMATDRGAVTFTDLILRRKGTQTITVGDMLLSSLTDTWSMSVL